jgi:hypothetical protein
MLEMRDDDADNKILPNFKDHLEKEYNFLNNIQKLPLLTQMIEEERISL